MVKQTQKEREREGTPMHITFLLLLDPACGMALLTLGWVFPTQALFHTQSSLGSIPADSQELSLTTLIVSQSNC